LVILLAMLVETAMSFATHWPLEVIIDNVVGHHKMSPSWPTYSVHGWMTSTN
jgi:subfamily B ATP-binding cassette protein MsbA